MVPGPQYRHYRRITLIFAALLGVAGLAGIGWSAALLSAGDVTTGASLLGMAVIGVLAGGLLFVQAILVHKLVNHAYRTYDCALELVELQRRVSDNLRTIAENSSLSEWAKRIVYREKDIEYLRDTIQGAVVRQDWELVDHLIRDMHDEFGYRDEAQRLRARVEEARRATHEEKIAAAVTRFDELCGARKWDQATRESARLRTLFPGDSRIDGLARELDLRRNEHKRRLLRAYEESIQSQNVDDAHRLLLELDMYLSASEGAALQESARGVFKAKLLQMGVQFSLAVTEHEYSKAIRIGEQLMREYPNTRYAREIAEAMPVLRQRVMHESSKDAIAAHT